MIFFILPFNRSSVFFIGDSLGIGCPFALSKKSNEIFWQLIILSGSSWLNWDLILFLFTDWVLFSKCSRSVTNVFMS